MANEADEVLLGKRGLVIQATAIKKHGKCTGIFWGNLRPLSREYDGLAKIGTKEAFTLFLGN